MDKEVTKTDTESKEYAIIPFNEGELLLLMGALITASASYGVVDKKAQELTYKLSTYIKEDSKL